MVRKCIIWCLRAEPMTELARYNTRGSLNAGTDLTHLNGHTRYCCWKCIDSLAYYHLKSTSLSTCAFFIRLGLDVNSVPLIFLDRHASFYFYFKSWPNYLFNF